jgi:hypothetical protein
VLLFVMLGLETRAQQVTVVTTVCAIMVLVAVTSCGLYFKYAENVNFPLVLVLRFSWPELHFHSLTTWSLPIG